VDGAFSTLERIQKARPDDLDAKLTEAELLLAAGEDALAQRILDRLAVEQPKMVGLRLLRARLLLNAGEAQKAADELSDVQGDAETLEVAEFKAEVLCALDRYEEADSALGHLLEDRPRDADILARLAEVKLNLGAVSTAEMLVEQALGVKPRGARALFMRGRIYEAQNVLDRAEEQFAQALKSDPSFAPALSRMWRIYVARGEAANAMSALERLLFMKMATIEEKAALAGLYADNKMQLPRARTLIAEAIKHDPKSAKLREIEKKLGKPASGKKKPVGGIEVMSWGKKR
jgi:tetratricopeptide (TPR) repeat protein